MNEKINNSLIPVVHLSTMGLDLSVEEGNIYKGTLTIESENGIPLKGKIYSTHDKMNLDVEVFEGQRKDIHYTIDATMARKDDY